MANVNFIIRSFEYKNEAGGDPPDKPANAPDVDNDGPKSYSIPVYSTHQLVIDNVAFYMEEFRIGSPRHSDQPIHKSTIETSPAAEQFYSTISELPDIQLAASNQASNDEVSSCSDDDNDNASDFSDINRTEALQIASFTGRMDIKATVKVISNVTIQSILNFDIYSHVNASARTPKPSFQSTVFLFFFLNQKKKFILQQALSVQGPKVQLELQLGAVNIFLTPRQLHALIQLSNTFLVDSTKQRSAHHLDHENDNDQASEYKAFNAMSGNLGLNQCWSSDPLGKFEKEKNRKIHKIN